MTNEIVAIARVLVMAMESYGLIGLLFAAWFAWSGVARLDSRAHDASWGFRLLIVPGAVMFWPLLLWRIVRGDTTPPDERNAHRRLAREH